MNRIIVILSTIAMLVACSGKQNPTATTAAPLNQNSITLSEPQLKNAGIVIGKMEEKEISSILKVNGKVDVPPQNIVSISVPLGGYLRTTHLLPGMHVTRGDVIAVMEDQQYIQLQQDYLTAMARIGSLENEYLRQKDLNQKQASSDKVYQQAEADYRTQRVLITSLAEKLKLTGINIKDISEIRISRSINILSPINGFVSKVNVNIGKYVSPSEVMFELINPVDIHLALTVFEKNLDKLFVGQKLMAYTNNYPDKKYPCEILLIGKNLSMEGNTEVHCHFETYDKTLVPGTYMNAEIEVKNKKVLALPVNAVVRFDGKQFVYKANSSNQFEMLEVTIGETENGYTEVIFSSTGNISNAEFVTNGAYSLLMMMKNKAE